MDDTFSQVKKVLVDLLGVEEKKVSLNSRFREDLEADSLDLVELVMELEDKYNVDISDEDAQKISTVGDAVRYIDRHVGHPSTSSVQTYYAPKQIEHTFKLPPAQKVAPNPESKVTLSGYERLTMRTPTRSTVFISYSRNDWSKYVEHIISDLYSKGIFVWVDQFLIQGGQDWQDEINNALKVCERMILCITPRALGSKYVKIEYRYFFNHNKLLIPVLCEPTEFPAELEGKHYIDYKEINKLIDLLR